MNRASLSNRFVRRWPFTCLQTRSEHAGGKQGAAMRAVAWLRRGCCLPNLKMQFNMLTSTREHATAIAVALGLVLAAPLSAPTFAGASEPHTAAQYPTGTRLRSGDLVRVVSGGPLMTDTGVQGDQVKCAWTDCVTSELKSETFPVAVLGSPVATPPDNPNDKKIEQAVDA